MRTIQTFLDNADNADIFEDILDCHFGDNILFHQPHRRRGGLSNPNAHFYSCPHFPHIPRVLQLLDDTLTAVTTFNAVSLRTDDNAQLPNKYPELVEWRYVVILAFRICIWDFRVCAWMR
jgi:hypothetical protein